MITGKHKKAVENFVFRVENALRYIDRPHSPTAQSIREGLAEIKRELEMCDNSWPRRATIPEPQEEKL